MIERYRSIGVVIALTLGCALTTARPDAATDAPVDASGPSSADVRDAAADAADAADTCRALDVPTHGTFDGGVCGLDGPFSLRFGGRVPTLAEASPCASGRPMDVQRVRYEYPRCNLVVIEYAGWYNHTRFVFDRTCGALLGVRSGSDTPGGCSSGVVDLSQCGEPESCVVCAEDPREVPPPASCVRLGRDAGTDGGG